MLKLLTDNSSKLIIAQSPLVIDSLDDIDHLLVLYNLILLKIPNNHAPEKDVPDRPSSSWISEAVIEAKQGRRRAKLRKKLKTGLVVHTEIYKQARNNVTKAIKHAKASHFHAKLQGTA